MTKKTKIVPTVIISREAMEAVVADAVRLKLEYVSANAAMEAEIAAVQKRHQDAILALARQIEIKEAGVYAFCKSHRKDLFPEKKSIDTLLATVGFRTNPPSVEKASGKDKWSTIADRLQSLPWGEPYLRQPDPEVNKDALIADRAKLTADQLDQAGIRIDQEETFFIDPKSAVAEPTTKAA